MTLSNNILPEERRPILKNKIKEKGFLRIIEVHNGISGIIANQSKIDLYNGESIKFDGFWESSFTDSASKGHPDAEVISSDSRLETISEILNVTNLPIIVDGDTGGEATNFEYFCTKLERLGVSAVIIEDKVFPKRNSLEAGTKQTQEDPYKFANKIKRGKKILKTNDFMIIARIESLIANKGLKDALKRARIYLKAGVDGIMIHSKEKNPQKILEFTKEYNKICKKLGLRKPLISVPTSYNHLTETELKKAGFNIVIYANHLFRASHKAMKKVSEIILTNQRSLEADPYCSSVKEVFKDVGFIEVKEKDKKYKTKKIKVIIPAAGKISRLLKQKVGEKAISAIKINDKSIIQRQVETLNQSNLFNINLITGYKEETINYQNVKKINNKNWDKTHILDSLFQAKELINDELIYINGDLLFSKELINQLLTTKEDIILIVDKSFKKYLNDGRKLNDFVIAKPNPLNKLRLMKKPMPEAETIGKKINPERADYEFTGIAYFSKKGSTILKEIYEESKKNYQNQPFQEAENFSQAAFTDLLQEIIDRGFKIKLLEINKGWIEIHDSKDYEDANEMIK